MTFRKEKKVHSRPSLHIIVFFFVLFRPSFITCSTKIIWMHCSVLLSLLAFFETIKSPWPSSSYALFGSPSHTSLGMFTQTSFACSLWFVQFLWFFCMLLFFPLLFFFIAFSAFHWLTTLDDSPMLDRARALCVASFSRLSLSSETENRFIYIWRLRIFFFLGGGQRRTWCVGRRTRNIYTQSLLIWLSNKVW